MNGWGWARTILCAASATAGFIGSSGNHPWIMAGCPILWQVVILAVLLVSIPPALLFVIGVQSVNPWSNTTWTRPHWNSPFLRFGDPLHFFHVCGYLVVAQGVGLWLGSPFVGVDPLVGGAGGVGAGIAILLSLKLCMRVFAAKYAEPEAADGSSA